MIRDDLMATGNDGTLIDTWYRKDSNAVPPVSVLQPISSILINFNNKVRVTESCTTETKIKIFCDVFHVILIYIQIRFPSASRSCKQKTKQCGGIRWVNSKSFSGKPRVLYINKGRSTKTPSTTTTCQVKTLSFPKRRNCFTF